MMQEDEESNDCTDCTLVKTEEVEVFTCSVCAFESENVDEAEKHILLHETVEVEDSEEEFQVICDEVSQKSKRKVRKLLRDGEPHSEIDNNDTNYEPRRKRKRKNEESFTCGWCNYTTTEKSEMKLHRQTHSTKGNTIFKCSQCSYETKRKNDMPKHMLGHCTDVEMFSCPHCTYKTKRKCDLPKHLLRHKPIDSVPLYKCDYCTYVTKRKGDLPKHVMKHQEKSELSLYNCTECGYVSKRMNDLHKHMLLHCDRLITGVFKCLKCPYACDKVVKISKHIQSRCQLWEDSISPEHLMLEDILNSADKEPIHVVLDPDDDEYVEEYQYDQVEGEQEQHVQYISSIDDGQNYVVDENGQVMSVLTEDVLESEIVQDDNFVEINENEVLIETTTNQGVFNLNLGEFTVEVPSSSHE
ncbi:uncharacterized protein [Leptinotarsa decemlineata]|uniref:uncharacterized protein n=1 Tax=Leptinotarsa decemlineata TaxID=7539 RepID=UPI003D308879